MFQENRIDEKPSSPPSHTLAQSYPTANSVRGQSFPASAGVFERRQIRGRTFQFKVNRGHLVGTFGTHVLVDCSCFGLLRHFGTYVRLAAALGRNQY